MEGTILTANKKSCIQWADSQHREVELCLVNLMEYAIQIWCLKISDRFLVGNVNDHYWDCNIVLVSMEVLKITKLCLILLMMTAMMSHELCENMGNDAVE